MRTLPSTIILALAFSAAACGRGPKRAALPSANDTAAAALDVPVTRETHTDTLPPCNGPCPMSAADVQGVYVLVEKDGRPLPSTTHYSDPETPGRRCTAIVESETLTLREDGTFEERALGRNWCNDMPTPSRSDVYPLEGTFGLHGPRGDSISMGITMVDPPIEMTGVLADGELRLVDRSDVATPRSSFRYVRARD